jgi:hypothetical protein
MSISNQQYANLQAEACRMAAELPKGQLLAGLVAICEAGRLLHLTKSGLIGLLGSVVLRLIEDAVDPSAPPAPPAAGMWPRVIQEAGYDDRGNLQLGGIDDNDCAWHESVSGRSQEAWLLKQLYVERRFGRRRQGCSAKKMRRGRKG